MPFQWLGTQGPRRVPLHVKTVSLLSCCNKPTCREASTHECLEVTRFDKFLILRARMTQTCEVLIFLVSSHSLLHCRSSPNGNLITTTINYA